MYSSFSAEDITVRNGVATGTIGGVVRIVTQATASIQRCRFQNNQNGASEMGAEFAGGGSASTFQQCVFEDNYSNDLTSVVGLAGSQTTVRFLNTLFHGNTGNAAYTALCERGSMEFVNCTLVENPNQRTFGQSYGGKIAIYNSVHDDTSIPEAEINVSRSSPALIAPSSPASGDFMASVFRTSRRVKYGVFWSGLISLVH